MCWVQGEVQCCVTGPAFEHLLQLGNASLLETVMRNVVVFSRMKPHQKGQVMDLLGSRGLHQMHAGQQQHVSVSPVLVACALQYPTTDKSAADDLLHSKCTPPCVNTNSRATCALLAVHAQLVLYNISIARKTYC